MRAMISLCLASLLAAPVAADPVDERTARKALFSPKGFSVEYREDSGLSETQLGYFKLLVESRDSKKQFERVARYYGAIAVSPSLFERSPAELLLKPEEVPFQFVGGYHSPAAASVAAKGACDELTGRGEEDCVVAALILPRRWEEREVSMSYAATTNFKLYRKADGPKAFAVSTTGKGFGLANGEEAEALALEACRELAEDGARDCEVVVADE